MTKGLGFRSQLSVPILREGQPIGVLSLQRRTAGPFSDAQIELVQTFADQAVIAIENARLLSELEARNRDLTDALDRQTATAEVLRVISRSQTDLSPSSPRSWTARCASAGRRGNISVRGRPARSDRAQSEHPGSLGGDARELPATR